MADYEGDDQLQDNFEEGNGDAPAEEVRFDLTAAASFARPCLEALCIDTVCRNWHPCAPD